MIITNRILFIIIILVAFACIFVINQTNENFYNLSDNNTNIKKSKIDFKWNISLRIILKLLDF